MSQQLRLTNDNIESALVPSDVRELVEINDINREIVVASDALATEQGQRIMMAMITGNGTIEQKQIINSIKSIENRLDIMDEKEVYDQIDLLRQRAVEHFKGAGYMLSMQLIDNIGFLMHKLRDERKKLLKEERESQALVLRSNVDIALAQAKAAEASASAAEASVEVNLANMNQIHHMVNMGMAAGGAHLAANTFSKFGKEIIGIGKFIAGTVSNPGGVCDGYSDYEVGGWSPSSIAQTAVKKVICPVTNSLGDAMFKATDLMSSGNDIIYMVLLILFFIGLMVVIKVTKIKQVGVLGMSAKFGGAMKDRSRSRSSQLLRERLLRDYSKRSPVQRRVFSSQLNHRRSRSRSPLFRRASYMKR